MRAPTPRSCPPVPTASCIRPAWPLIFLPLSIPCSRVGASPRRLQPAERPQPGILVMIRRRLATPAACTALALAGLAGPAAARDAKVQEAVDIATDAYVYGYSLVTTD